MRSDKSPRILDLVSTAAILVTCGVVVVANWAKLWPPPGSPPPKQPVSLEGATLKGNPEAPVVLIEWSDYQCPYCAKAERDVLPAIEEAYIRSGRVQLALRHNPLTAIHPHAAKAAEAALCAGRQGKFWEMHAELFRGSGKLAEDDLVRQARTVGVDLQSFTACLRNGDTAANAQSDIQMAQTLGLSRTPTFLVGKRRPDGTVKVTAVLTGARPFETFAESILAAEGGRRWASMSLAVGVALTAGLVVWRRRRRTSGPIAVGRGGLHDISDPAANRQA